MSRPEEPARISDLEALVPYVRDRAQKMLQALQRRGFRPLVVETKRTRERQAYLYGLGRTKMECVRAGISPRWAQPDRKLVTQTMKSKHLTGKALDVIDKRYGWRNMRFFDALDEEAQRVGLVVPYGWDRAHVEWRG